MSPPFDFFSLSSDSPAAAFSSLEGATLSHWTSDEQCEACEQGDSVEEVCNVSLNQSAALCPSRETLQLLCSLCVCVCTRNHQDRGQRWEGGTFKYVPRPLATNTSWWFCPPSGLTLKLSEDDARLCNHTATKDIKMAAWRWQARQLPLHNPVYWHRSYVSCCYCAPITRAL